MVEGIGSEGHICCNGNVWTAQYESCPKSKRILFINPTPSRYLREFSNLATKRLPMIRTWERVLEALKRHTGTPSVDFLSQTAFTTHDHPTCQHISCVLEQNFTIIRLSSVMQCCKSWLSAADATGRKQQEYAKAIPSPDL